MGNQGRCVAGGVPWGEKHILLINSSPALSQAQIPGPDPSLIPALQLKSCSSLIYRLLFTASSLPVTHSKEEPYPPRATKINKYINPSNWILSRSLISETARQPLTTSLHSSSSNRDTFQISLCAGRVNQACIQLAGSINKDQSTVAMTQKT